MAWSILYPKMLSFLAYYVGLLLNKTQSMEAISLYFNKHITFKNVLLILLCLAIPKQKHVMHQRTFYIQMIFTPQKLETRSMLNSDIEANLGVSFHKRLQTISTYMTWTTNNDHYF